ncbi:hypothetical protein V495_00657 [Pseudogymnoascus sp. VKM F-4514 (FW-929)]|nr:hypothetical protein V495_00657 [Pseudogymnoascus sp. VKM F-4514 (FW-929)]KFY62219.1 hypothetical protein V497_02509 [Pseudogymnoascus sp. VKM F-4516 (FW-969)]
MAPQDGSPTVQVEETQYDANKEPYVQASQPDTKKNESPPAAQKSQAPGQLMTPTTPRSGPERTQTPPIGPAPSLQSQFQDPQSPRQESEDGNSESSDDGPEEEHPEKEKMEPHTLPEFDWEGLEANYFAAMDKANEVEAQLGEEFRMLANYFAQWSNVPALQDSPRAVKRFKTRQEHVYHSEDMFSQKKQHYEKVVFAFKSAMELLQAD